MFYPGCDTQYVQIWLEDTGDISAVFFPELPYNFDRQVAEYGISDADYPSVAWRLVIVRSVSAVSNSSLAASIRISVSSKGAGFLTPHIKTALESGETWERLNAKDISDYMARHARRTYNINIELGKDNIDK